MFRATALLLFTVLLALPSLSARAEENTLFMNFASCSSKIDGIPVTLDLFAEYDADTSVATGKGYVMQTATNASGESMKTLGKLKVKENADQSMSAVEMYAVLEPGVLFATFNVDLQKESTVEIYAVRFGAVWGVFQCVPMMAI